MLFGAPLARDLSESDAIKFINRIVDVGVNYIDTSIDYGVAERAENIAVVPGDFGWSDVGSFNALPEVRKADANGNVVSGEGAVVIDCQGCVVVAQGRPLAVVGMVDTVVVDAGDAVLVLPKDKSQDVRKVVEALRARKLEKYL